jgi:hypothetical protein
LSGSYDLDDRWSLYPPPLLPLLSILILVLVLFNLELILVLLILLLMRVFFFFLIKALVFFFFLRVLLTDGDLQLVNEAAIGKVRVHIIRVFL